MLVNKKSKWKSKFVAFSLVVAVVAAVGTANAAQTSAHLDGSSTSKKTSELTATNGNRGNIYVTNSGANTTIRGYGKRVVRVLPDSTVASTNWLNPGNSSRVYFTQSKDSRYYGQIVGQTVGSRGSVTLTVY